jgi:hypothetical protein
MSRRLFLHLLVPAIILLAGCPAMAENRMALVIGQSAYRSVPALPNPANDAQAMTQLLSDSGFEVSAASDLSQDQLREKVSEFASQVAAKGPDTVALVFYAGHGLQIDGENYLIPVDIDVKREADIPIQAVRLNDILNTLTSVPSKMRILLLDACRNNPFPEINKTAGHGLAIVDAKTGAPGTFVSFSTSPGAEAEDGNGNDSPYTTALLTAAREPGLPIEETFKRVRVSVNKATEGRQTPWDSSSLTDDFSFRAGPAAPAAPGGAKADAGPKQVAVKRTVEDWKHDLKGKPVEAANEMIVGDGSEEAYEAFVALYTEPPFGPQARQWLDRHRRMVAWNIAVITNTVAGYRAFLAEYPDSDLTATARKLEERLRNRPSIATAIAAVTGGAPGGSGATPPNASSPINASLPGPTCPCSTEPSPLKKVDVPKPKDSKPPKRADKQPPKRGRESDDDVVVYRHPPPPDYYEPSGPSVGIGIGGGGYGGGFGGGGFGRGGGGMMPGRRY